MDELRARPRGFDANLIAGAAVVIIGLGFTPIAPFIGWGIVVIGALAALFFLVIRPIYWNWQLDRLINMPLDELDECDEDPTTDPQVRAG